MANSSYVGLIKCPHCGNENATVHQQQTGTKKGRLYYRCYSEINGAVMLCGTIQCIGQSGQDWINANMRPIGQKKQPEPKTRPIAQPVEPESPPAPEITENEPISQPEQLEPENEPIAEPESEPLPVKKSILKFLTEKPSRETRS